jgi:two-component system chemotaxis response regulator CheB
MLAAAFEIIALAASAGGLKALSLVLAALPAGLRVPLAVVQHLAPGRRSLLADILSRRTALGVKDAAHAEPLQPGVAYIAPSDHHLLINHGGLISLTQTELVHFVRPSADLLLESVAASYRERAIAVILSGSGTDGAMGVKAIKKMGGTVIVQKPDTCEFRGMPDAALQAGCQIDLVLPLDQIAPALLRLVNSGREA